MLTAPAERPRQRVGGQLGGMQLARAEAAELGGDLFRADRCRFQDVAASHQRHRGAAGGGGGAAAVGVEAGVAHPFAVDAHAEAQRVAAGDAAGGYLVAVTRESMQSLRRGQVVLEREGVHAFEDKRASGWS